MKWMGTLLKLNHIYMEPKSGLQNLEFCWVIFGIFKSLSWKILYLYTYLNRRFAFMTITPNFHPYKENKTEELCNIICSVDFLQLGSIMQLFWNFIFSLFGFFFFEIQCLVNMNQYLSNQCLAYTIYTVNIESSWAAVNYCPAGKCFPPYFWLFKLMPQPSDQI